MYNTSRFTRTENRRSTKDKETRLSTEIEIGQIILNKYHVEKLLGRSTMSDVYIIKHKSLNHYRVMKCISKANLNYQRLVQEAQILQSLNHPSIPKLYDCEEDEKFVYLIEEYIRGESVRSFFF